MRKQAIAAAICTALVVGTAAGASAMYSMRKTLEVQYSGLTIRVNDRLVNTGDSEPFVVLAEGRTYIPARYLAESMGGKVLWDSAANAVRVFTPDYVRKSGSRYELPFFDASVTVEGERLTHAVIDSSPEKTTLSINGADVDTYLHTEHWGTKWQPPTQFSPEMMLEVGEDAATTIILDTGVGIYSPDFVLSEPKVVQVNGSLMAADFTGTAKTVYRGNDDRTWNFAVRVVVTPKAMYTVMVNDNRGNIGERLYTDSLGLFDSLQFAQ